MNIPFFDLHRQARRLRGELSEALMEVVDSQRFVQGPAVDRFESAVAAALSVDHAIGVASGSDALLLALMAAGIGPESEVIVPAFSFFATASAPLRLGARVVFADIGPSSFQIDPDEVRKRITSRTRAVVVAHLFGDCAEIGTISEIGKEHGVPVVEDAAQAFGARHCGRLAGTFGFCGCFSFYPTKNLGALGDGGMIVTNDPATADRVRMLANHGARKRYEHVAPGINSRLDALQAAALTVKLRYLEEWNQRRGEIARRYSEGLGEVVTVPSPSPLDAPVFHQFVIRTPARNALRSWLKERGVGTEIYYPIPLHLQSGLTPYCGQSGDHPRAETAADTALALPVFPELEDPEVAYVISAIRDFFDRGSHRAE